MTSNLKYSRVNEPDAWLQTLTGGWFYPLDPRLNELKINDIFGALSKLCRYGGHTKRFYSVAEHSYLVSIAAQQTYEAANPGDYRGAYMMALWGLFHDSAEAYLVDIPKPLKPYLPQYKQFSDKLSQLIFEWVGLIEAGEPPVEPTLIKAMDTRILLNERSVMLEEPPKSWGSLEGMQPIPNIYVRGMPPTDAEYQCLYRYVEICRELNKESLPFRYPSRDHYGF